MKIFTICYLIFFGIIIMSCGGKNSAFIGKWFLIEGGRGDMPSNFEILKNGTGFALENNAFTWNVENNLFYISSVYDDSDSISFLYKISDSRFELTNDNGKTYVYSNKLGGSSDILGTWKHINKLGESFEYVFEKNGTLIVRYQLKEHRSNWMSMDETLYLFNEIIIYKYSVIGNILTLTYSVYDPINDNFEDRIFLYEKVR